MWEIPTRAIQETTQASEKNLEQNPRNQLAGDYPKKAEQVLGNGVWWPTTVTAKEITSRQKQKTHSNKITSRQKYKSHSKKKMTHGKNNNLKAKETSLRYKRECWGRVELLKCTMG